MVTKLRAIVFDRETRTLSFVKIKDKGPYAGKAAMTVAAANGGEAKKMDFTASGRIIAHGQTAALMKSGNVWPTEGINPRRYVLLAKGDPRALMVDDLSVHAAEMSDEELYFAIETKQATRFHRGGLSWQLLLMIMMGFAIIMLAAAVVTGA